MGSCNIERVQQEAAAELAEAIVSGLEILKPPVDPFQIIASERGRLVALGDDFGDDFDGRLEYQSPEFLLFYNTRYNEPGSSDHHPRVTFTVAHELGHFFLDRHHQYLKKGGKPHGSRTEFISDNRSEREADAFAASLLMPRFLVAREVNRCELSIPHIEKIAGEFRTSLSGRT